MSALILEYYRTSWWQGHS